MFFCRKKHPVAHDPERFVAKVCPPDLPSLHITAPQVFKFRNKSDHAKFNKQVAAMEATPHRNILSIYDHFAEEADGTVHVVSSMRTTRCLFIGCK